MGLKRLIHENVPVTKRLKSSALLRCVLLAPQTGAEIENDADVMLEMRADQTLSAGEDYHAGRVSVRLI